VKAILKRWLFRIDKNFSSDDTFLNTQSSFDLSQDTGVCNTISVDDLNTKLRAYFFGTGNERFGLNQITCVSLPKCMNIVNRTGALYDTSLELFDTPGGSNYGCFRAPLPYQLRITWEMFAEILDEIHQKRK